MLATWFSCGESHIHICNRLWESGAFGAENESVVFNPLTVDFLEQILAFYFKNEYKIRILQKSIATICFQKVKVLTNFVVNFGC